MLSFKALSEKKTKIKINPRKEEMMEKLKTMKPEKAEDCHCDHTKNEKKKRKEDTDHTEGYPDVASEAVKKKDDSYLETDFKKRQKNNEKARKDLMKGPQMKNPHFESTENAYVSQEEVSEESDQSIEKEETSSLLRFGQFTEGLSIDDQMRISREHNRKSPEEKRAANKRAMGNVKKVAPKKDTRTDAQKMTDATGPRPGSRYRGD